LQKAKTLRFHPEIPEKEGAADRLEVGQVFKIVLRFRHSFWEEDDFVKSRLKGRAGSGRLNFVHADDSGVPVWWTALPARVPVLTGWAGGPKAELLLNESEQTRVERTLAALTRVLAVPRRLVDELLESWSLHDWRADPFSRGAYSYVGVGALTAQKTLAMPAEGTLFFGGEATDSDQAGTVAGAIASGRRAAHELLRVRRA
jgi:monoamine oxidase